MKEKAMKYFGQNYNCSQCILRAAEDEYGITISSDCYDMCKGINNGFGVGTTCSALIAGTMVLGILFDERTTTRLRLKLFMLFQNRYRTFDCCKIKKTQMDGNCKEVIRVVASILEEIISTEKKEQSMF